MGHDHLEGPDAVLGGPFAPLGRARLRGLHAQHRLGRGGKLALGLVHALLQRARGAVVDEVARLARWLDVHRAHHALAEDEAHRLPVLDRAELVAHDCHRLVPPAAHREQHVLLLLRNRQPDFLGAQPPAILGCLLAARIDVGRLCSRLSDGHAVRLLRHAVADDVCDAARYHRLCRCHVTPGGRHGCRRGSLRCCAVPFRIRRGALGGGESTSGILCELCLEGDRLVRLSSQ
mmetsp:Transcript_75187/g.225952  ORF Transcript_75187/g.225952 Transcript_75187/m.225952 type:complete len:233 (-) Transcript_75187:132-830(-)